MKTKNSKKVLIGLFALIIIGLILVTIYIMDDRKMISTPIEESRTASAQPTQTILENGEINIGLIGDSWVAGEKLDQFIETELKSSGIDADVVSFGQPGAKSRDILNNLISDSSNVNSSNSLLLDDEIDIIVVIAGVNDTAGHIGSDFYTHHMLEIIKTINKYNKLPIILEVPEYGIEEPEPFKSALKHNLYKILFDSKKTDVIEDYRDSLKNQLTSTNLDYTLIPFEPAIKEYNEQTSLYSNPSHLNEEGNKVLGTYIGNFISNKTHGE